MSKRSVFADVTKEERKYILKRDEHKCIFCGKDKSLTMVHVFVSRGKGGKGNRQNIVTGCVECHYYTLDNPLFSKNNIKSLRMQSLAEQYLIMAENITDVKQLKKDLIYKKEIEYKLEPIFIKPERRCEECRYLVKNKFNNSTIPTYFCLAKKKQMSKKNETCAEYKGVL